MAEWIVEKTNGLVRENMGKRFMGFAPFVAGIALMHPTTFFFYNITGCILWVGGLVSAGYFLGNLTWVRENFGIIVYAIIVISVLPVAVEVIRAKWGRKKKDGGPDAR